MKKLIYILTLFIGIISISSCSKPTVEKSDLPIEVVKLKESQKFDTILTINTNKNVYLFQKQGEFIGKYVVINEDETLFWVGFLLGIGIITVLFKIIID